MSTQLSSNPKNSSQNSSKFSSNPTVAKLWNRGSVQAINPDTLPILPLATVEMVSASPAPVYSEQQASFDAELAFLKDSLLQSRRSAILARSQSMDLTQRQALCHQAQGQFQEAQDALQNLGTLARRLGVEARRKFRAIEGAQEWRSIRHTIFRSGEMNQLQLAFAA